MHRQFSMIAAPLGVFALAVTGVSAASLMVATPAAAQSAAGCEAPRSSARSIGRSILGRVIGDVAGRATSTLGYAARFVPSTEVADTLTDAIACRLDQQEQVKAKQATLEATRSERVGTSVSWTSDTRANVSGTSTIVARNDEGGQQCMLVDDVIIVNGEETVNQKRMCRVPPQTRYILAA
jgi:surface antigen